MTDAAYDVAIAGAGIVGAACALECAQAGLRACVVEHGPVGGGATAAGMGHIVVMEDSEAEFALTRFSQQLWDELADALPEGVDRDPCGTLWVAADNEEMDEARRKHAHYAKRGLDSEILDADRLAEAEPNLRPGLAGGMRIPGDSIVYPPVAAAFLLERACQLGCTFRGDTRVARATAQGFELPDGGRIAAGLSVNACGAGATAVTPGLPVRPRKGHLVITDRYPGFVSHQLIELGYVKSAHASDADSVAFNVQPRKNGQLLIGSSRQFDAEDTGVEPGLLARMLDRALEYLPRLGGLSAIRAWTGHRAATPDKLPLVGPWAPVENHLLATGHEGLGITTSLATARLLVDLILDREPAIPVEPYLPQRFLEGHDA